MNTEFSAKFYFISIGSAKAYFCGAVRYFFWYLVLLWRFVSGVKRIKRAHTAMLVPHFFLIAILRVRLLKVIPCLLIYYL